MNLFFVKYIIAKQRYIDIFAKNVLIQIFFEFFHQMKQYQIYEIGT